MAYTVGTNPDFMFGPLTAQPVIPEPQINPRSIYGQLDSEFTIFKNLIDKTVLFKNLASDENRRSTFFVVPDQLIPDEIKNALSKLSRGEATQFLSSHWCEFLVWFNREEYVQKYPTRNPNVKVSAIDSVLYYAENKNSRILSDANPCSNGIIYVLDKPIVTENWNFVHHSF